MNDSTQNGDGVRFDPEAIKEIILTKYGSLAGFCIQHGFNYSTLYYSLEVDSNPKLKTIKRISEALDINIYI